jgi:hypothetical protein
MNILKLFSRYESDIYDNPKEQLKAMRRWDVEWQKHVCSERFHIKKNRGKFTSDEFFKFVRDTCELIDGEVTYEGVELYPITGPCTTHACKAHATNAKIKKPIHARDISGFYSCEVRIYPKNKYQDHDHIWLSSENNGKRIKWQMALSREHGDKIIDKYFVEGNGYSLGDGFV